MPEDRALAELYRLTEAIAGQWSALHALEKQTKRTAEQIAAKRLELNELAERVTKAHQLHKERQESPEQPIVSDVMQLLRDLQQDRPFDRQAAINLLYDVVLRLHLGNIKVTNRM